MIPCDCCGPFSREPREGQCRWPGHVDSDVALIARSLNTIYFINLEQVPEIFHSAGEIDIQRKDQAACTKVTGMVTLCYRLLLRVKPFLG